MVHTTHLAKAIDVGQITQVTDVQLQQFAELIYQRTGIRISPRKKLLLSNRLKQPGISSFGDYYKHLVRLHEDDPEWDALLQEVTTHETYLFRDEQQWEWFRKVYLPGRADTARRNPSSRWLRIWSAACRTGDEAVTAACCIAAALPDLSQWRVNILGTDIGVGALEHAREATFSQRAMRLVPEELRRRFFVKSKDADTWRAQPILTNMLTFRQHNLMEPLREKPFDLVMLKNVLIYFDQESKAVAIKNILSALAPGGLLMAGAAEGVADHLRGFQRIEPWLFRKP